MILRSCGRSNDLPSASFGVDPDEPLAAGDESGPWQATRAPVRPRRAVGQVDPPLALLRSSGTTGPSKLVTRSTRSIALAATRFGEEWGAGPGVTFLVGSLAVHAAALCWGIFPCLLTGATLLIPRDRRPDRLLSAAVEGGAHFAMLVPAQGRALAQAIRAERMPRGGAMRRSRM